MVGWIKHGTKTNAATKKRIHQAADERPWTMVSRVDPLRLIHPTSGFRFMERNEVTKQSRVFWAAKCEIASSQCALLAMTNLNELVANAD